MPRTIEQIQSDYLAALREIDRKESICNCDTPDSHTFQRIRLENEFKQQINETKIEKGE